MKFHPSKILPVLRCGIDSALVYCGFAIYLVTGGLVNMRGNKKIRRRAQEAHARAKKPPVNRALASKPLPVVAKTGGLNDYAWPKPTFHRKRRKKIFNYSKFYMNVVTELSSRGPARAANGISSTNGHANDHSNGHGHGHSNGHAATNGTAINQTIGSEIKDLIAGQGLLIQKQKFLLEEQSRLIEEKNRIIEEQSAFLKTRFGLAGDQRAAA